MLRRLALSHKTAQHERAFPSKKNCFLSAVQFKMRTKKLIKISFQSQENEESSNFASNFTANHWNFELDELELGNFFHPKTFTYKKRHIFAKLLDAWAQSQVIREKASKIFLENFSPNILCLDTLDVTPHVTSITMNQPSKFRSF